MADIGRWIVLILFIAFSAAFMPAVQFGSPKWPYWKRYLIIGVPSSISFVLAALIFHEYIDFATGKVARVAETYQGRLEIAGIVICAGIAAHVFKRKRQILYGQVEVLIGAASAFTVATGIKAEEAFSRWVTLVACAYVVARGLNNWSEGLMQRYGHPNIQQSPMDYFVHTRSGSRSAGFHGRPLLSSGSGIMNLPMGEALYLAPKLSSRDSLSRSLAVKCCANAYAWA